MSKYSNGKIRKKNISSSLICDSSITFKKGNFIKHQFYRNANSVTLKRSGAAKRKSTYE